MEATLKPTCSTTHEPATLVCVTDSCERPAFGCSNSCLLGHKHGKSSIDSRTIIWEVIEPTIRGILTLGLTEDDIEVLEKQEKTIQAIMDQLRDIHSTHSKYILEQRKLLKLKDTVQNIGEAIHSKSTESITGKQMAELIKGIKDSDLYTNKVEIEGKISAQRKFVQSVIGGIQKNIEQFKGLRKGGIIP